MPPTIRTSERPLIVRRKYTLLALLAVIGSLPLSASPPRKPPKPVVDAQAMRILKSMSDFLGRQDQFTYKVVNMREDLTPSGHRVDHEVASEIAVDRPGKLRAIRQGHLCDQEIYYNGRSLVIYNPGKRIYSAVDAPDTIDATLKYARETLGM